MVRQTSRFIPISGKTKPPRRREGKVVRIREAYFKSTAVCASAILAISVRVRSAHPWI